MPDECVSLCSALCFVGVWVWGVSMWVCGYVGVEWYLWDGGGSFAAVYKSHTFHWGLLESPAARREWSLSQGICFLFRASFPACGVWGRLTFISPLDSWEPCFLYPKSFCLLVQRKESPVVHVPDFFFWLGRHRWQPSEPALLVVTLVLTASASLHLWHWVVYLANSNSHGVLRPAWPDAF